MTLAATTVMDPPSKIAFHVAMITIFHSTLATVAAVPEPPILPAIQRGYVSDASLDAPTAILLNFASSVSPATVSTEDGVILNALGILYLPLVVSSIWIILKVTFAKTAS